MSPSPSMPIVALVTLLGGSPAQAEDRGAITATANFALGSSSVGDAVGFLAPGGHFDVGFRVRAWRLAAELETALWSTQGRPDDARETGSFLRGGVALRWHALDVGPPPREAIRLLVAPGRDGDRDLGLVVAFGIPVGR